MRKVMLIDDDVMMVDLLKALLEMEGFEVSTHSVKEDVIASVQNHEPDVILIDVHLKPPSGEDKYGLKLLARIREIPGFSDTRVIMTSGIDFRIESKEGGADGFLLKPYMPEELIGLIKRVCFI